MKLECLKSGSNFSFVSTFQTVAKKGYNRVFSIIILRKLDCDILSCIFHFFGCF